MKKEPFSLQISDDAEVDLDKSYEYYKEENQKLADIFFNQIKLSLEKIKQNPHSFPIEYKDVRKFVVKKFPFVIYFQSHESIVKIIAIFHTSRNPEIWNERK